MPRRFVTEKDIEDMFRRGERTLTVTDGVSLTDLAFEKARKLGVQVIHGQVPSAPVRPYIVKTPVAKAGEKTWQAPQPSFKPPVDLSGSGLKRAQLEERIRAAVARQLGDRVDPKVVETIIKRILDSTGVR